VVFNSRGLFLWQSALLGGLRYEAGSQEIDLGLSWKFWGLLSEKFLRAELDVCKRLRVDAN
jgi:hypothetical protein